jgi:hypothetical protein
MGNIKRYLIKKLFIFGIALPSIVLAGGADIVVGTPGSNVTLWKGFNVSGTVFVKLNDGEENSCAKLWWIRMGKNSDIGTICGTGEIDFKLPLIYGEIRAGHLNKKTAFAVSDDASVAYSQELCGKIIDC